MDNIPFDSTGLPIHYSGKWEEVDMGNLPYKPGKNFRLCVGTPGKAKVKGFEMKNSECVLYPLQEGYNPIICDAILADAGTTADDVFALF